MATALEKLGTVLASPGKSAIVGVLAREGPRRHAALRQAVGMGEPLFGWHVETLIVRGILDHELRDGEFEYALTDEGRRIARRVHDLHD